MAHTTGHSKRHPRKMRGLSLLKTPIEAGKQGNSLQEAMLIKEGHQGIGLTMREIGNKAEKIFGIL